MKVKTTSIVFKLNITWCSGTGMGLGSSWASPPRTSPLPSWANMKNFTTHTSQSFQGRNHFTGPLFTAQVKLNIFRTQVDLLWLEDLTIIVRAHFCHRLAVYSLIINHAYLPTCPHAVCFLSSLTCTALSWNRSAGIVRCVFRAAVGWTWFVPV